MYHDASLGNFITAMVFLLVVVPVSSLGGLVCVAIWQWRKKHLTLPDGDEWLPGLIASMVLCALLVLSFTVVGLMMLFLSFNDVKNAGVEQETRLSTDAANTQIVLSGAGGNQFQQAQSALRSDLQQFDKWRQSGIFIHPLMVSLFSFPDANLKVTVNGQVHTGADAQTQMQIIAQ